MHLLSQLHSINPVQHRILIGKPGTRAQRSASTAALLRADERSQPLFTRVRQVPLQAAGLLLGDDGVGVIRKNDHEEPVETRLFQAPLR